MNVVIKFYYRYAVYQVDAWKYDDDWSVNDSFFVGDFLTSAKDHKRAFIDYLRRRGISFKLNRTLIEDDGSCFTVVDRKTKEPLFIAAPQF